MTNNRIVIGLLAQHHQIVRPANKFTNSIATIFEAYLRCSAVVGETLKIVDVATDALTKIGTAALSTLETALTDRDKWIRYVSAAVVPRINESESNQKDAALLVLREATQESNWEFRFWAAAGLSGFDNSGVPDLVDLLRYDTYVQVRAVAAAALGQIGSEAKEAVPFLTKALTDSDHRVQRVAVEVLGKIGSEAKSADPAIEAWKEKQRSKQPHTTFAFDGYNVNEYIRTAEKALERIRGLLDAQQ